MDDLIFGGGVILAPFIIGGIIYFVILGILASTAKKWGHSGVGFWFIGFLTTPLLGFIILLIAGDNRKNRQSSSSVSGLSKKCPFCANDIKYEASVCQYCHRDIPQTSLPNPVPKVEYVGETWKCKCGADNPSASNSCKDCGEYR
jgi:hypothetical protein